MSRRCAPPRSPHTNLPSHTLIGVTLPHDEAPEHDDTPKPDWPLFRTIDRHGNPGKRLTGEAVGHILKRHADNAGIDPNTVSGHSLRRGFATEPRCSGADLLAVCRHGRWQDGSRSVLGYFADVDGWNDSPLNSIGL